MMYFLNNGQLQRMRTREAFQEDAWGQSDGGIIFPVAQKQKPEEKPAVEWRENAAGLLVPVAPKPTPRPKPTAISLFTGAGGFDIGFARAGFCILAATDHDTSCCHTYGYNVAARPVQMHFITEEDRKRFIKQVVNRTKRKPPSGAHWERVVMDKHDRATFHREGYTIPEDATPHYFLGDVRKLTGAMILEALHMKRGEIDCVCGGPPCQGFSQAGRREVMDPRNSLVFEFARLIIELVPKFFVFENVPGIVSMVTPEGIPVLDAFCHMLEKGGYASYEGLKQGLEQMQNAWGAVKNQGKVRADSKKNQRRETRADEREENALQMSLFEEE
jgi:DNA (cytosine-5)-methyltransferase 1